MNLIDRYVYAATERLPQDTREDVIRELCANIEDMLPEEYTESDILEVLEKLGNPIKLADEYNQRKRYLIGPGIYDSYISVLKLVTSIVAIVFICLTLIEWALKSPLSGSIPKMSITFFLDIMLAPIQGIIQGFIWVTVVFVILEKTGIDEGNLPFANKKWSPADLPTLPVSKKRKISRAETVFSIFCTVFFTVLIYFQSQLIGLYTKDNNGVTLVVPLFDRGRLQSYITVILLFAMIQLCIFIWKFITRKWTLSLAIANALHNIFLSVFLCVMLSDNFLFNQGFLAKLSEYTNTSLSKITEIGLRSLWISVFVFITISIIDSVMGFVKSKS